MTRRLTQTEALELIETAWSTGPDLIGTGMVEVTVTEVDAEQTVLDAAAFAEFICIDLDMDSITVRPDRIEGSGLDAVTISIKTEER